MGDYDEAMLEFCRQVPKVELHAHLNGSIREATIRCGSARVNACAFYHYEASCTLNLVIYNRTEYGGISLLVVKAAISKAALSQQHPCGSAGS